ncbi:MAG TPA: decaprenyl-phosphate phosphoribosyltransferase [Ilumatobacteraceae bacterium]|nr:decaprenyl-phosphate phosphoribosyltransferase [Ilumatobacteraceae bacterium]
MLGALLNEARPKQWAKNVLVFAAPGAAGVLDNSPFFGQALIAFAVFCLVASGTYFVNDLLDVDADRAHPTKSRRPIAAGRIPVPLAWAVAAVLLGGGIALGFAVRWQLAVVAAAYVVLTLAYSAVFKHVAVVDLTLVAAGFVIRAIGGAVAVDVKMSTWFLLCTSFGSLFIVTGKRYAEIRELGDDAGAHRAALDEYTVGYLRIVLSVAMAATLISYCIWAFDTKEL